MIPGQTNSKGSGAADTASLNGLIHGLFYGRHGEAVRYIFIGGLNVVITWGIYAVFVLAGLSPSVSNAASWVIGVAVAFVLNKIVVFGSHTRKKKAVRREAVYFAAGRAFTGIVNIAGFSMLYEMGLDQELMGVDGFLAKIIISVIEIALNYAISKYVVFVKKTDD